MTPSDEKSSSQAFFSKYAEDYAKSAGHAHGADLTALIKALRPKGSDIALDVATGTGFTAMELAEKVRMVIAIDITEKMLDQARTLSSERGIENMRFEIADAGHLPYGSSSFDIVTTRRAAHHFADTSGFLSEASRVLRNGGKLGIADLTSPEGTQHFFNSIERIRDSSHKRAMTEVEWRRLVESSGLKISDLEIISCYTSFEQWMYPVRLGGPEEFAIRQEWNKAQLDVREQLGVRESGGRFEGFTRSHIVIVATN
ncbi:MAG: class I SAM-dependent methyltransferase [Nitrososphaerales archaeon]